MFIPQDNEDPGVSSKDSNSVCQEMIDLVDNLIDGDYEGSPKNTSKSPPRVKSMKRM
jgi:hypothetical protein